MMMGELARALATRGESAFRVEHPEPALVFHVTARKLEGSPVEADEGDAPPPVTKGGKPRPLPATTKLKTDRSPDLSPRRLMAETHNDSEASSPEGWITRESEVVFLMKSDRNPFGAMITVGRAPNNDIWIPLSSVSKMHAYFVREGGQWRLTDQNSSNGTEVDGAHVPPNGSVLLRAASEPKIRFGPDVIATLFVPERLCELLKRLA